MTTTIDLDRLIRSAMDHGITAGLIPAETAEMMRARLSQITAGHDHAGPGCPVCVVRALTEGEPTAWFPSEPATVKGVVLWVGTVPSRFAMLATDTLPVVDLWLGGMDRVRVVGYGSLARELDRLAPTVGDTLTVAYTGQGTIERGKYAGRAFRMHTVEIERGHH